MRPTPTRRDGEPAIAWWRLPIVWMVIAGPAIVVVASFATLTLAIIHPDPVLSTAAQEPENAADPARQPAMDARNHAASPRH
jgi:hypothetical protein